MIIKMKVMFIGKSYNEELKLNQYDFNEVEGKHLPFSVYSSQKNDKFEKLESYKLYDLDFSLTQDVTKKGIVWKLRGV